tara:strand:+ start:44542 stop:45258 length:717 start_codon:yes stop_codon:yes gene_type:complete
MTPLNSFSLFLAAGALLVSQPAHAVEITGGSVGLSYSAFADNTDFSRLGLDGSVELGFNRNLSVQADLGYSDFNASGLDSKSLGLHGIYHMDDATSFGAFYTMEDTGGDDVDIFGLEAGYETGVWDFEGYLANADGATDDATMVGIMGRFELADGLGITGSYDRLDMNGGDLSRTALRLDRDVAPNANMFVEVGAARASAAGMSNSEAFVGFGGKISFGADRGATFSARDTARLLPGL